MFLPRTFRNCLVYLPNLGEHGVVGGQWALFSRGGREQVRESRGRAPAGTLWLVWGMGAWSVSVVWDQVEKGTMGLALKRSHASEETA